MYERLLQQLRPNKAEERLQVIDLDDDDDEIRKKERVDSNFLALYTFNELPSWLQFNNYIHCGYRKNLSFANCLRSIFRWHNESGNIWTHLIAAIAFVGICIETMFLDMSEAPFIHKFVIFIYLLGAIFCFFSSTIYHTFMCHSEGMINFVAKIDYSGISALILGSFYPPLFYSFYCHPVPLWIYITLITILGLSGLILPMSECYHKDSAHVFRVMLLAGMSLLGVVPALHARFYVHQPDIGLDGLLNKGLLSNDEIYLRVNLMYLLYALGLAFYLTRFPESTWPGKFDHLLHSHQIWHVFVVAATYVHYFNCIHIYNKWRILNMGDCAHILENI